MLGHSEMMARLRERIGIAENHKRDPTDMSAEIKRMTESLNNICELCKPRLIMGGIRYGSEWDHEPMMKYMQKKFDTFKKTGNFEMLVDFVNFCAIEGALKTHPNFHFKAIDRW